jgi:hypothetical protein
MSLLLVQIRWGIVAIIVKVHTFIYSYVYNNFENFYDFSFIFLIDMPIMFMVYLLVRCLQ